METTVGMGTFALYLVLKGQKGNSAFIRTQKNINKELFICHHYYYDHHSHFAQTKVFIIFFFFPKNKKNSLPCYEF